MTIEEQTTDPLFREHVRRVAAFIADYVKDECPIVSETYEKRRAEPVNAVAERVIYNSSEPKTMGQIAGMVEDVIHGMGEDGMDAEKYYRPSAKRPGTTEAAFAAWCSRGNRHSAFAKIFAQAVTNGASAIKEVKQKPEAANTPLVTIELDNNGDLQVTMHVDEDLDRYVSSCVFIEAAFQLIRETEKEFAMEGEVMDQLTERGDESPETRYRLTKRLEAFEPI